ncbi:MAG: Ig-like surface protein, partial [Thermoleophilia bacterium]|nr:Ig-like surface protein [Thermoleophilia bacterium]
TSVAVPTTAHAALILDPGYTSAAGQGGNSMGQSDDNGVMYTASGTTIRRYGPTGARLADINLAGIIGSTSDVAPSPDGRALYIPQGTNPVVRVALNAAGNWVKDPAWKLQNIPAGGTTWTPVGSDLFVDGRGDIYFSTGSNWVSNAVKTIEVIAKFQPDGTYITAFGEHGTDPGQWNANQDVVVSRDGKRVYVGENCGVQCIDSKAGYQPSRVARWDYVVGTGQYRYTKLLSAQGATNGHAYPYCEDAGAVHSAYSLAIDNASNVYATSTTCGRIQQFATNADPAKDKFVKSIATYTDATGAGVRNHYLNSDLAGRLFANEWSMRITPNVVPAITYPLPTPAALPLPDVTAPKLTTVTMPASTTTRAVPVTIAATDDTAVTELRLANEDGTWGPWQPFAATVTQTLTAGYATKGVSVQVRDMAGNESNSVYRTISYAAQVVGDGGGAVNPNPGGAVDVAAPVVASATIPAITATRTINVTTQATDDIAVTGIRIANEDGAWGPWTAYKAVTPWTLTAGYTNKLLFIQVRDGAGNESGAITAKTRLSADAPAGELPPGAANDTVAPTLTKFTLPATTTTQTLATTLVAADAVGVAQVRFANEDGNWGAWIAYSPTAAWTLTPGYSNKLVFAQVRDAAGNESLTLTAPTSYVKTAPAPGAAVDAADPTLTAITLPATTRTVAVTVKLTAGDDVKVTEVRFANEDGEWLPWKAYAPEVPHTLTAGNTDKVVFAQVRDAAGKESNVLFARTLVQP